MKTRYPVATLSLSLLLMSCASEARVPPPLSASLSQSDSTRIYIFMPQAEAEALFDTPALERKFFVHDHSELGEVREEIVRFVVQDDFWSSWSAILNFQRDSLTSFSIRRKIAGIWPPYDQGHMEEYLQQRFEAVDKVHGVEGKILSA